MRTTEEIVYLYKERLQRCEPMHQAAIQVRAAYYGDITLPLPELDRNERPLVPNLVYSAGEQKAMRVASTMPNCYYPSTTPGQDLADKRARQRRLVNLAWWDLERMKIKMRKRARHMVYYAATAVKIEPNFKDGRPSWKIRNPLATFAPIMDDGEVSPPDVIFTYPKSYEWVMRRYPDKTGVFENHDRQDGIVTMLEYQDEHDTVLIACGERTMTNSMYPFETPKRVEANVELERVPNKLGRCAAVVSGGVGLDYARGSFDGTLGMWQALGKMMALEAIGTQRAIWPELWLTDDPNRDGANIIQHADPLHGIMGHITGGKIDTIHPLPEAFGTNLMDRLERGIRVDAGIPPEIGGESQSNVRTGKRGDSILSAVLDFPMQEMQELLAVALQEEDKIAVAIDKAYFPTKKSIYLSATAGEIDYEADKLWETDTHFVSYSHAGVDAQGIVIELGQLVGTGMISKRSAMETHPLIEDPQGEFDRIEQEKLDDALLAGMQQMAQDPQMAPIVAQVALKLRSTETAIPDAVLQVHTMMQEMQAQQAQQQQMQQQGAMPGGPPGAEAQPGMAQPVPAIAEAPQSLQNLTGLLQNLRKGGMAAVPNTMGLAS